MSIVEMIVGNLHVGESYLTVCKTVLRKLKDWRSVPKRTRRSLLRQAIRAHKANRKLYAYVQTGFMV